MSNPWNNAWFEDCDLWYGRTLTGRYGHWCPYIIGFRLQGVRPFLTVGPQRSGFTLHGSDGTPIDETVPEFAECQCFDCICGVRMIPQDYPFGRHTLDILDDWFTCPSRRAWNFWKHKRMNLGPISDLTKFKGRLR